jgi:hypothetical protein
METIPLRDAIGVLRSEILAARQDASTEEVRFELGPIEMEFQVVASKNLGATPSSASTFSLPRRRSAAAAKAPMNGRRR